MMYLGGKTRIAPNLVRAMLAALQSACSTYAGSRNHCRSRIPLMIRRASA